MLMPPSERLTRQVGDELVAAALLGNMCLAWGDGMALAGSTNSASQVLQDPGILPSSADQFDRMAAQAHGEVTAGGPVARFISRATQGESHGHSQLRNTVGAGQ
jgi:hypothetical protein